MSRQKVEKESKPDDVTDDCVGNDAAVSSVHDGDATSADISQAQASTAESRTSPPIHNSSEEPNSQLECPICLQPAVHPVELPCTHIFCFLCIKGVAMQGPNGRCAICRSSIPHYVLTNPRLKDVSQLYKDPKSCGYQWFYESRGGGWWQYDERTMQELERCYESGQTSCQLLIAGHLYEIDFSQMIQYRANNRNLFRRIKRDLPTAEKRGIAGIRLNGGPGDGGGSNPNPPGNGRRRRGASYPGNTNSANSASNGLPTASATAAAGINHFGYNPLGNVNGTSSPFRGPGHFDAEPSDSDDHGEDESEESDLLDEEEEDDMELGEEEEALIGDDSDDDEETEDDEEDDTRDGARAPTRRSDRSTSSSNQTPPPPAPAVNGNGASAPHCNSHSANGRTRGGRNSRGRTGSRNSGRNPSDCTSPLSESASPISARSIQISTITGSPINNNQSSGGSIGTGLTCILIGPGVRITVDRENANGDEIL